MIRIFNWDVPPKPPEKKEVEEKRGPGKFPLSEKEIERMGLKDARPLNEADFIEFIEKGQNGAKILSFRRRTQLFDTFKTPIGNLGRAAVMAGVLLFYIDNQANAQASGLGDPLMPYPTKVEGSVYTIDSIKSVYLKNPEYSQLLIGRINKSIKDANEDLSTQGSSVQFAELNLSHIGAIFDNCKQEIIQIDTFLNSRIKDGRLEQFIDNDSFNGAVAVFEYKIEGATLKIPILKTICGNVIYDPETDYSLIIPVKPPANPPPISSTPQTYTPPITTPTYQVQVGDKKENTIERKADFVFAEVHRHFTRDVRYGAPDGIIAGRNMGGVAYWAVDAREVEAFRKEHPNDRVFTSTHTGYYVEFGQLSEYEARNLIKSGRAVQFVPKGQ